MALACPGMKTRMVNHETAAAAEKHRAESARCRQAHPRSPAPVFHVLAGADKVIECSGGTVRRRDRAVLMPIANPNLFGCSIVQVAADFRGWESCNAMP